MTRGGDTDDFEDEATMDESADVADEDDDVDVDEDDNVNLDEGDAGPTAAVADIEGTAGEPDDGGQTGTGKGPTDR